MRTCDVGIGLVLRGCGDIGTFLVGFFPGIVDNLFCLTVRLRCDRGGSLVRFLIDLTYDLI